MSKNLKIAHKKYFLPYLFTINESYISYQINEQNSTSSPIAWDYISERLCGRPIKSSKAFEGTILMLERDIF